MGWLWVSKSIIFSAKFKAARNISEAQFKGDIHRLLCFQVGLWTEIQCPQGTGSYTANMLTGNINITAFPKKCIQSMVVTGKNKV